MEASKKPDPMLADAVRAQDPVAFFALGASLCQRTEADADQKATELDDAAWAHARLSSYGDSADELVYVRAFVQAARGEPGDIDDHSDAALDGYRAGRRYALAMEKRAESERGPSVIIDCPGCDVELIAHYSPPEDEGDEPCVSSISVREPDRYDHRYGCPMDSAAIEAAAMEAIMEPTVQEQKWRDEMRERDEQRAATRRRTL